MKEEIQMEQADITINIAARRFQTGGQK